MSTQRTSKPRERVREQSPFLVRLDKDSKEFVAQAAELRGISPSEYIRTVTVAQAKREVLAAREQTVSLTPEEQLAFWKALSRAPRLTQAQQRLGRVMRSES